MRERTSDFTEAQMALNLTFSTCQPHMENIFDATNWTHCIKTPNLNYTQERVSFQVTKCDSQPNFVLLILITKSWERWKERFNWINSQSFFSVYSFRSSWLKLIYWQYFQYTSKQQIDSNFLYTISFNSSFLCKGGVNTISIEIESMANWCQFSTWCKTPQRRFGQFLNFWFSFSFLVFLQFTRLWICLFPQRLRPVEVPIVLQTCSIGKNQIGILHWSDKWYWTNQSIAIISVLVIVPVYPNFSLETLFSLFIGILIFPIFSHSSLLLHFIS